MITDTYFSVIITQLFLQPETQVMDEGKGVADHAEGYRSMQESKLMTLTGSTIAVASSTVFYVMAFLLPLLYFFLGGNDEPFWANPWLNVFVFWINFDSFRRVAEFLKTPHHC